MLTVFTITALVLVFAWNLHFLSAKSVCIAQLYRAIGVERSGLWIMMFGHVDRISPSKGSKRKKRPPRRLLLPRWLVERKSRHAISRYCYCLPLLQVSHACCHTSELYWDGIVDLPPSVLLPPATGFDTWTAQRQ